MPDADLSSPMQRARWTSGNSQSADIAERRSQFFCRIRETLFKTSSSVMSGDADHRRKKQGIKTFHPSDPVSNGSRGPTSQIPGLSHNVEAGPEERTRGRRVGIFETDSDYVKLAKQGGAKGLLWHEESNVATKAGGQYKPPDWFSAELGSKENECFTQRTSAVIMTPEEAKKNVTEGTLQPVNAPFGGDNKSAWERENDITSPDEEQFSEVNQEMDKMTLMSDDDHQVNKFKKTSFEKKRTPVSMSKLLSFGYAEDEKKSPIGDDDDEYSVTSDPRDPTPAEENTGPGEAE
ncbi:uncharacterized protein C7orf57-like [Brienomyrus brachyistius]|uniref:uncharacterized protein C7orf57-like n=1 Tax=Brienomyrus brachyistius TaxID=42636 RepID=UPI0020B1C861|nr:uncharacterized protein C7orf57-like [Brienomyrus brachyistius]